MVAPVDPRSLPPPVPGPASLVPPELASHSLPGVQVPGANTVEGPPPIPPPLSTLRRPHPARANIGDALARGWAAMGWNGKLLVVCIAYLAVNLLVIAFAGLGRQPKDGPVGDSQETAAPHTGPRFRYNVTDLGTLGGETSQANAINNAGQVVGGASTKSGNNHAFLWRPGKGMQDLGCSSAATPAPVTCGRLPRRSLPLSEYPPLPTSCASDMEKEVSKLAATIARHQFRYGHQRHRVRRGQVCTGRQRVRARLSVEPQR